MRRTTRLRLSREAAESERGATMPEYALMASLIMMVCIAAVRVIGVGVNLLFLSFPN